MKRFVVFVVLAMVVIGSCAAQSATSDAQKLVGTWVGEYIGEPITLVLNANGTGTISSRDFDPNTSISWGVSTSGEIYVEPRIFRNDRKNTFFLSPDGRRMIVGEYTFQKR